MIESQRCQLLDLIIGFKLSPLLWKHIQTSKKVGPQVEFKVPCYECSRTRNRDIQFHRNYMILKDLLNKISETTLDAEFEFTDDYYESVEQIDGETFLPLFETIVHSRHQS